MTTEFRLPQLGVGMTEARIVKWLKGAGERIIQGEPILEVETDKVITEVEAPMTGVLRELIAKEEEYAPVQSVIATIDGDSPDDQTSGSDDGIDSPDGDDQPTGDFAQGDAPIEAGDLGSTVIQSDTALTKEARPLETGAERIFVSPRAKMRASEVGLDLSGIAGTGPGGRVMEKDVEKAIAARSAAPTPPRPPVTPFPPETTPEPLSPRARAFAESLAAKPPPEARPVDTGLDFRSVPFRGVRRTIAERMVQSQKASAFVTLNLQVEMAECQKLRSQASSEWAKAGEAQAQKITYTDIIVLAVARALIDHPRLNASIVGDEIREYKSVNVGVAVALAEGLIVPVVRGAQKLTLREISTALRDLGGRAREGKLRPDEVTGGTFTVSNLGMYGIETFSPIINPSEAAILGVGQIADRPSVRDGAVVILPGMWLSLTFDHRVVDGAPAAQFLARVKELLESPYRLFL